MGRLVENLHAAVCKSAKAGTISYFPGGPLTCQQVCDDIRHRNPALLAKHKDALASVNTVLNRLAKYGVSCTVSGAAREQPPTVEPASLHFEVVRTGTDADYIRGSLRVSFDRIAALGDAFSGNERQENSSVGVRRNGHS